MGSKTFFILPSMEKMFGTEPGIESSTKLDAQVKHWATFPVSNVTAYSGCIDNLENRLSTRAA